MTPRPTLLLQRSIITLVVAVASLALSGCGEAGHSSRGTVALRMIHASPDVGTLDVYANNTALAYGVGFGAVSSYVAYAPGTYTLTGRQSGSSVRLTSTAANLAVRAQYTMLVGNVAAGLQTLLLQDQTQPAPAGQVALRFIDQATQIGPMDLYLVPQDGSLAASVPILTGITFSTAANLPAYVNVPASTYTLMILPNGSVPTATTIARYTGTVVSYAAGSAHTIILLDRPAAPLPTVQVIMANDYDVLPPSPEHA